MASVSMQESAATVNTSEYLDHRSKIQGPSLFTTEKKSPNYHLPQGTAISASPGEGSVTICGTEKP
jgi:hypothetical protein